MDLKHLANGFSNLFSKEKQLCIVSFIFLTFLLMDISSFATNESFNLTKYDENLMEKTCDIHVNLGDDQFYCQYDGPQQITANVSGGTPPYTYDWGPGFPSIPTITVGQGDTRTFWCTVTDANGCTGGDDVTIFVEKPTIDAGPDQFYCQYDGPQVISVNATGGTPPYTYVWASGDFGNTPTITVGQSETRTFWVDVIDANGCVSGDDVTIFVEKPIVDAGPDQFYCQYDGPQVISVNATGGTPPYTYVWASGDFGNTPTITVGQGDTRTFWVDVIDANGCVSGDDVTIVVEKPTVDAGPDQFYCQYDGPQTITANVSGGTPPYSYDWGPDFPDTPTITVGQNETGTFWVDVTDANGCVSGDDVTIIIGGTTGSASNNGPLTCTNTSVQLLASGDGNYSWSGPNGFASTQQNPTVSTAGTYTVTVTNNNGCTASASTTVEINDETPTVSTSNNGPLTCNNNSVTIYASGGGTYSWTGPNGFASTQQNPTVSTAGTYTVTVTNNNGCTASTSTTVEENIAVPNANAGPDKSLCSGSEVGLNGSGGGSYAWNGPNAFASTQQNPTVTDAGTYTLTVTNENGCFDTDQVTVSLADVNASANNNGPLTCDNNLIQLSASGGDTYVWTGPNGFSSTQQNPTISIAGTYTVTVTNANGCTDSVSTIVGGDTTIPTVSASNNGPLTCSNNSVQLSASGGGSYSWTGPSGFSSTLQNPTVVTAGTYTVTVTNNNGCTASASTNITQTPCLIDLELVKSVDQSEVNVGESVVWTISVVNEGPNVATGVSVGDFLPNGVTLLNANTTDGSINSNNLIWTIGTLGIDETATLAVTTSIDQTGTFINVAEIVSANEQDIDSTPNNMNGGPSEDDEDEAQVIANELATASLGDYVWIDADGDGLQDILEPGLVNVTVMLLDANGNMIDSQITDSNGFYLFTDLAPGDYKVKFPSETNVAGVDFVLTTPNQGNIDTNDSDAVPMNDGSGNAMSQIVSLASGETNLSIDAGYLPVIVEPELADLGNFTFLDYDDNGMYNPETEDPLKNIKIYLYDASNLNTPIDSTISDINGYYEFINLNPNIDYVVQFGEGLGTTRSSQSFPSSGGEEDKNDADFFTGFTDVIDLDPGEFDPTIDAGYTPFRGISGALILQGPAVPNSGVDKATNNETDFVFKSNTNIAWKMNANLLEDNLIPETDPYATYPQFLHVNNDFGVEAMNPILLNYSGEPDDIVDWIFVEVRDVNDPKIVVGTRSVLVQTNGQLVDKNGNANIALKVDAGEYYIAIRHRNHLGVMTANPVNIGGETIPFIDFTNPNIAIWGEHAQVMLDDNTRALWGGDANTDGRIIFQGQDGDNDLGFFDVLTAPTNVSSDVTFTVNGYMNSDFELNCTTNFQGPGNDNDNRFFNILLYPTNTNGDLNYIIEEKLPKN